MTFGLCCLGKLGHHTSQLVNSLLETSIQVILGNIISTIISFIGLTLLNKNVFEGEKINNQIKCNKLTNKTAISLTAKTAVLEVKI